MKPVAAADYFGQVLVVAQEMSAGSRITLWRSDDFGNSWEHATLLERRTEETDISGDPWLQTDRCGHFYLVYIHASAAVRNSVPLLFRRSFDAGRTWSRPIEITNGADRPVIGISPNGKRLVIASSLAAGVQPLLGESAVKKGNMEFQTAAGIFVSGEQGRRWRRLPGPLGMAHAIPYSAVIDDAGRLASSWIVGGEGSKSLICSTIDCGETWTQTELVVRLQSDLRHPFSGERFPVIAETGNGNLHVAFVGERGMRLLFRRSKNWIEWLEPIQLSSDDAAEVRMSTIGAHGPMVHVMWFERQGELWQAYYRGSKNYGVSWSERLMISVPFAGSKLIDENGFKITCDDDQASITDDGNGVVHVVWAVKEKAAPKSSVWHSVIRWER